MNAILLLLFVSLSACGLNGSSSGGGGGSSEAFPPIVDDMEVYTVADYPVTGTLRGRTNDLNFPPDLEDFMRSAIFSPYSYAIVENGTLGTATLIYAEYGHFEYTPHPGTTGVDSFTYTLTDPFGTSEPGIVTVMIGPPVTPAPPIPAEIERVSVSDDLAPANGNSGFPTLDGTGRHVAFVSDATNLAPETPILAPNVVSIFVRDLDRGTTELVRSKKAVYSAMSWAGAPTLSDDGHRIAFSARETPDGNPGYDNVLVHNMRSGRTELASRNEAGEPGDQSSYFADLSASGQHVTFYSAASNLLGESGGNAPYIYLRDLKKDTIRRLSQVLPDGGEYYPTRWQAPQIDGEGRFVTFSAYAPDYADHAMVVLHDTENDSNRFLAVGPTGTPGRAFFPTISADGAYAAYFTAAALDPADTNGALDAYLEEIATGRITRMGVDEDRYPGNSTHPPISMSGDGRFSVFAMAHINHDVRQWRVHLFDRETGETVELMRHAHSPAISTDGRWIAFGSDHPELAADSPDQPVQIYVMPNPLAGAVDE